MKSFLLGLGIGAGLGVLFAPRSGEETGSRLSDQANGLANSARETMEHGPERVQRGMSSIRGESRPTGTESPNL